MGAYPIEKIRNICLLGHGSDGKTSLAESLLFQAKATDRLGKVSDGNTVCDFDPEEIRRGISISAALAPVEYKGYKVNIIDCPGFFDFIGEVLESVRVSDAGLIAVTAKSGINVGFEKSWRLLSQNNLPKMVYISKIDEENADYFKVFNALRAKYGISVCPVTFPVMEGGKLSCIVDVVTGKAFRTENGKTSEVDAPASAKDPIEEYRSLLSENVAETSEELMDKFFAGESFTEEELRAGIRAGVRTGSICPVFAGSATLGAGTESLLEGIVAYAPSPDEGRPETAVGAEGEETPFALNPKGAPCLFVFKTVADQYGRFSYFKVVSGSVSGDLTLTNSRSGANEKLGHIYLVRGKKNAEVDVISCGDIGAVAKLTDTRTGDTLSLSGDVALEGIHFPKPCYSRSLVPKGKGAEDKIASGLTRLKDEDPCITTELNAETHQQIISGMGDIHIDVICSKLKSKFGVEVTTEEPRVAYREKIRKKVQAEGKHKKQSGGHGQYGHVKIEFEPGESAELDFGERIFGGSVPKNFHPAVEKGLRESMLRGPLAGYPVVNLKATLYDGSYHDVDSNELSFKMAARIAYKTGMPLANPIILEPVGTLKVYTTDEYMGDVIGDLNKRRGRVLGMNPTDDGMQMVEAEVPFSEMYNYAIELRSMTHGWGSFEFVFARYEETPPPVQQQVIETAKQLLAEEEEE